MSRWLSVVVAMVAGLSGGCVTDTGPASVALIADFTDGDGDPGSVEFGWDEDSGDIEADFGQFECAQNSDGRKDIVVAEGASSFSFSIFFTGGGDLDLLDVNLLDGNVGTNRSFDDEGVDIGAQPMDELDCSWTGGYPELVLDIECEDLVSDPEYPDAGFIFALEIACPRWRGVLE